MSKQVLFLMGIFLLYSGCAHVIPKDIRDKSDPSLTFAKVLQNQNIYKGKTVLWGGEIVETRNQKNGTTGLEVFQLPLDFRDAPKVSNESKGRFLMRSNKYLDPYLYQKGRKITVAGEILGKKLQPLGEMSYRYTVVAGQEIYLWEESYYTPPLILIMSLGGDILLGGMGSAIIITTTHIITIIIDSFNL